MDLLGLVYLLFWWIYGFSRIIVLVIYRFGGFGSRCVIFISPLPVIVCVDDAEELLLEAKLDVHEAG